MLWPFFAVVFDKDFGLSIITTGTLIASGVLVSIICSIYAGIISDRVGRKLILITTLSILLTSTVFLIFIQSFFFYLILLYSVALGKGVIDTIFKAIISDEVQDTEARKHAFYFLYYAINIGGAIGPFLGVSFELVYPSSTFIVISLTLLVLLISFIFVFKNKLSSISEKKYSFFESLYIVRKDKPFILLIISFLLVMLVFDQFDSTLVQFFSRQNSSELISLVGALMVINCVTVLIFQFPLLKLISSFSDKIKVYLGISLFAIAQIIFALTPVFLFLGWISATIILTLGEIILFSIINLQIDKMAPNNLKGAYFGAANLYSLGLFLAPLTGGILLEILGRTSLFLIMATICLIIFITYKKALILNNKKLI